MAAGVEEAVVICPFMTPLYQASRSCKKELNYADSREVFIVPVMLAHDWEASEWLGLITAGLLWVDFRDADKDEQHFKLCMQSLTEEIMYNAGHVLAVGEAQREPEDQPGPLRPRLRKKPGRGFRHAATKLYLHEIGEMHTLQASDNKNTVELSETLTEHCYWEEIKGNGCKYYRNVVTNRYLGFHPGLEQVFSAASPCDSAEWLLLADQTDQSDRRAIVIKNKQSGIFLAVQDGCFTGLTSYNKDCRWYLA